jgi:molecular chaperone GrpE
MNNEKNKDNEDSKSEEIIENVESENEENIENAENLENEENAENNEKVTNLLKEIEELRDEKLRLLAEMENLRKRSEKEKIDSIRYGSINLARDMLSPNDNLTRAFQALPKNEKMPEKLINLVDGLKMVQKELTTIFEKHGVKKIESIDKKFDHNVHQAMVEIENDEVDSGTVIQEMQSGYTMHDRLLRPSMVGVSKKSIKTKVTDENSEDILHEDGSEKS